MEKVQPNFCKNLKGYDFENEIDRIYSEVRQMDDIDFEIILNTDILFYLDFMEGYNRANKSIGKRDEFFFNPTFQEFKNMPVLSQKARYSLYLRNVFMFTSYFSKN